MPLFALIDPYILAFSAITVAATIFMGFWSARRARTASDFFVAGRSVSVGWNASAISGEYLSAASFMGVAGMVMSSGYDALWYPVCYACGYLFLLLFIAGPLRRFGAYTIPDFAEGRFDSPMFRKIAVVFVLFIGFFYTMPQMKGAGTTLAYVFKDIEWGTSGSGEIIKGLPYWVGVVIVGAVITLNVALGGMKGITLVQAFQYWAKMFAISVPIFVLMAVYGHYGKQLESIDAAKAARNPGPTSPFSHPVFEFSRPESRGDAPNKPIWSDMTSWVTYAKRELAAHRAPTPMDPTNQFSARFVSVDLDVVLAFYSTLRGKTVLKANVVYPVVKFDYTPTNSVTVAEALGEMDGLFVKNGVEFFPYGNDLLIASTTNWTSKLQRYLADYGFVQAKRKPLPDKAPKDETWLNPFGPLTTKAAKAANASPRWNVSSEIRSKLVDHLGQPPPVGFESLIDSVENFFDRSRKPAKSNASQFADWTNMPPNTSRSIAGGFPLLSTLSEYGLLVGRPVLVATNLPRPKLAINGSFQSRDQFLKYLESLFLTNGVRLDPSGDAIKAVPVADWDRYVRNPASVAFVPNQFFSMHLNVAPGILIMSYEELVGKRALMAANLPTNYVDFNPTFEVMLAHETKAAMEKMLTEHGVTLIPASDKEVWAVPTTEVSRYRLPPIDSRPYSLLYTYSLIIALVCGTAGLPHILVRFYTNPDGVAAKRTTMWVMILIGVFYLFPPVFGVMGRNLLPELYSGIGAKGTDKIVLELPRILNERFGVLGSILSGITCAGAFAAFMSTFSGLLVSMTGALAHDVYGRMLHPQATPAQRMRMFKWCAVLVGGIAVLLGSRVEKLEINFMVGQAFAIAAASYFPLLFMSVWWRNLTMKGAAAGMLTGGLLALAGISLTSFTTLGLLQWDGFWAGHPLLRILCEQPAIWAVPLAIALMVVISKLTKREVPSDIRMKMLVLHAPEKLGLKQEYIQEARELKS